MRVILYEIKKIFNLKTVAVALVVSIFIIGLWDLWRINILPYGDYDWEVDLLQMYGTQLTPDEAERAKTEYIDVVAAQADEFIKNEPLLAAIGITNLEEYTDTVEGGLFYDRCNGTVNQEWLEEYSDEKFLEVFGCTKEEALRPATPEELAVYKKYVENWAYNDDGITLQNLKNKANGCVSQLEYAYDKERMEDVFIGSDERDEREKARIKEIFDTDEFYNLTYENSAYKIAELGTTWPILLFFALVILLSPSITRDNMTGASYLQYSSKTGRKTLVKQLIAMLSAGFIIIALVFGLSFAKILIEIPDYLLETKMNGFNTIYDLYWFGGTVWQFALLFYAVMAISAVGFILYLFAASHTSKNYIQMLLKILPVFGLYIAFYFIFGQGFFSLQIYTPRCYDIIPIPYSEFIFCAVMLLSGLIPTVILLHKNKGRDMA